MNASTNARADRLYELLPAVYRERDAERGWPLKALLRVIAEQVNVVEDDVARLYENWFIETCDDWVVPYIGDLVGYRPVHEAGDPGDPSTAAGAARNKILIPRREVANTVRYRRKKGTLALLELLARDVAGWPSRAVEFCVLLGRTRDVRLGIPVEDGHGATLGPELRARGRSRFPLPGEPPRGGTVDLRAGDALDRRDGPFDELAHTVDVRRTVSRRRPGRYNIPSAGLFAWRLRAYPVTRMPAYCLEQEGPYCFTFSVLGNDTPLFTRPEPEPDPASIAGEPHVPVPIRRRRLESHLGEYYGEGKSFALWDEPPVGADLPPPIPPERLVVADLKKWHYHPEPGEVAIDPVRGRIAFHPHETPSQGLWVSYGYAQAADLGGGEYPRGTLPPPPATKTYRVGDGGDFETINQALLKWQEEAPGEAVIELTKSAVYVEQLNVRLRPGQSLELRAAELTRPVIRLLDWQTGRPDSLCVRLDEDEEDEGKKKDRGKKKGEGKKRPTLRAVDAARFTLDGILVTGRGVMIRGGLDELVIRHSTLVPGWSIDSESCPRRPNEPSLELYDTRTRVSIEHSIVGTIQVHQDEVTADPIAISVTDSILDATGEKHEVLGAPGCPRAHAVLTIRRSTVIGRIQVHVLELGENCLFLGRLDAARRQVGCLRFSWVQEGSRTPRRYRCQPDLVKKTVAEELGSTLDAAKLAAVEQREACRVRPAFTSVRYGTPGYCQLDASTAEEIRRGADDRSEMGVYHDLYQPQRAVNLRARLDEYTPAGMETGLIYAT